MSRASTGAAASTGSPTAESVQAGDGGASQLAAVRRATASFHNIDKAIEAGYASPVGGACDPSPAGTMGAHTPNPALLTAPLDAEKPAVLLYIPSGGGNYRLVAVEYFQAVLVRNTATGAVTLWFGAALPTTGYAILNPAPSLFGQRFQGPMAGHVPGMPWHYDLHVWLWDTNPNGMFAQWNPSISCN
ncbi:MAG: hypothetical protein ABIS06_04690 [Vicinamibacterales bacterium]